MRAVRLNKPLPHQVAFGHDVFLTATEKSKREIDTKFMGYYCDELDLCRGRIEEGIETLIQKIP